MIGSRSGFDQMGTAAELKLDGVSDAGKLGRKQVR
jgi:hypothetical protein